MRGGLLGVRREPTLLEKGALKEGGERNGREGVHSACRMRRDWGICTGRGATQCSANGGGRQGYTRRVVPCNSCRFCPPTPPPKFNVPATVTTALPVPAGPAVHMPACKGCVLVPSAQHSAQGHQARELADKHGRQRAGGPGVEARRQT